MAKNFSKKRNKYSRTKEELPTHVIFCEGETEINYFKMIKRLSIGKMVKINDVTKMSKFNWKKGSLKSMVTSYEKKQEQKGLELPKDTKYWFIFDVDEINSNISLLKELLKDLEEGDETISVIYTNPIFEYWMLLHIEDSKRKCGKANIENEFKNFVKNESKPYNNLFKKIQTTIDNEKILKLVKDASDKSSDELQKNNILCSKNFTNAHVIVSELLGI